MKRYRVTSKFRDKSGRTLRTADTFDGAEEDAKCALVEAHKEMARVCAADPRIESITSTVKGPEGEISTTDYADELGTVSDTGLMQEVSPEDLEPARGPGFAVGGVIDGPPFDPDILREVAHGITRGVLKSAIRKIMEGSVYGLHGDEIVSVDDEMLANGGIVQSPSVPVSVVPSEPAREHKIMFPSFKLTPEQEALRAHMRGLQERYYRQQVLGIWADELENQ